MQEAKIGKVVELNLWQEKMGESEEKNLPSSDFTKCIFCTDIMHRQSCMWSHTIQNGYNHRSLLIILSSKLFAMSKKDKYIGYMCKLLRECLKKTSRKVLLQSDELLFLLF